MRYLLSFLSLLLLLCKHAFILFHTAMIDSFSVYTFFHALRLLFDVRKRFLKPFREMLIQCTVVRSFVLMKVYRAIR